MTLIDGFCSHHCTLTDELHIIEVTIHVKAVYHQMQMGNTTLGVMVQSSEILGIGNIGRLDRCGSLAFSLANVVHLGDMVYLMNELIKASLPVFHRPVSCFFLRWRNLKAYGCKFNRLLGILLLEHRLVQNHFVPHTHRRQILAKMVGLNDVCAVILCCVIGHCLTMLNGCCFCYHIMSIKRSLMLLHSLSLTP